MAFVVCQAVGLDANTASSDYIALYMGSKEKLAKSLGRILRTAARIIEGLQRESSDDTEASASVPEGTVQLAA